MQAFMAIDHRYDKFIVQALVGNAKWSSAGKGGTYYHVGTIPNRRNSTFVADVRMMIGASKTGFSPLVVYGRRARTPLLEELNTVEVWSRYFSFTLNLPELNPELACRTHGTCSVPISR